MKAGAVTHFIVSDVLQSVDESFLASFPGLPTVQFLSLSVCKNEGGRPGPFYHWNDVSVYLVGRRGWGGGDALLTHVLRFEPGVVRFSFCKRSKAQCLR